MKNEKFQVLTLGVWPVFLPGILWIKKQWANNRLPIVISFPEFQKLNSFTQSN